MFTKAKMYRENDIIGYVMDLMSLPSCDFVAVVKCVSSIYVVISNRLHLMYL